VQDPVVVEELGIVRFVGYTDVHAYGRDGIVWAAIGWCWTTSGWEG
jgi:hypothetical protein